jgi:IS30 family transposase
MSTTDCYSHLSAHERDRLAVWHAQGWSLRKIAAKLKRSPSTLSRELHRNSVLVPKPRYLAHRAHSRAFRRNSDSHRRVRIKSPSIRQYIEAKLRSGWSPELIAGRIRSERQGSSVSHEAIYQWIYHDARHLISLLPRHFRKRMRRGYCRGKHHKSQIPERVSISQRPKSVATRRQAGHWEADTFGNRKSRAVILVLHERKSRFTKLCKLRRRGARALASAAIKRLSRLPPSLRLTITFDNGPENVEHSRINSSLGTRSFFCNANHSWEKGSVENVIGVLRRRWPKDSDFSKLSSRSVRHIERWINRRPRKCLDYKSPSEIFAAEFQLALKQQSS